MLQVLTLTGEVQAMKMEAQDVDTKMKELVSCFLMHQFSFFSEHSKPEQNCKISKDKVVYLC